MSSVYTSFPYSTIHGAECRSLRQNIQITQSKSNGFLIEKSNIKIKYNIQYRQARLFNSSILSILNSISGVV